MTAPFPIIEKLTHIPSTLVSLNDYEKLARRFLPRELYHYIASGSDRGVTTQRNVEIFNGYALCPRPMQDMALANTQTELFGLHLEHPIILSPISHHGWVHPLGETATASGAKASSTTMTLNQHCCMPPESVALELQDQHPWYQLHWTGDRDSMYELIEGREALGFDVLMLSVGMPLRASLNQAQRQGFLLPLPHQRLVKPERLGHSSSHRPIFQRAKATQPSWHDIEWLRAHCRTPLLIKGLCHTDDVYRALNIGVDGIVVSNFGGRGLDGTLSSLELLQQLRLSLGEAPCLLLDGGIRRGTDIIKAMALGANAVMLGRPQLYALAIAGGLGVAHMMGILRDELEAAMALCGLPDMPAIRESGSQQVFKASD